MTARADPNFTVSGARDHYRQQAQSSGVVLERVSEFGNFFSELPNFPAQSLRLRASDKVPAHVPRGYRPLATTRGEVAWKSSADRVSGNNRYRFFRRPVMPARGEEGAEEVTEATHLGGPPAGGGGVRGLLGSEELGDEADEAPGAVTMGTQSDYRESEAQTTPYEPDTVLPAEISEKQRHLSEKNNLGAEPEVLLLKDLRYDGPVGLRLPAGLAEVEKIEKMREKRAFEASLPPISDLSQMGLRKKMLEEWERREWEDREQEIVELQEEQLRVLAVERDQREARIDETSNQRLKALQSRLLHDKQQSLTQLQKQRVKVLRTLGAARQRAEWKVEKKSVIAEYASYSSNVYAPSTKLGKFPEKKPRGQEINPTPFEPRNLKELIELEDTVARKLPNTKVAPLSSVPPGSASDRARDTVTVNQKHIYDLLTASKGKNDGERGHGTCWPEPVFVATEEVEQQTFVRKKHRPQTPTVPALQVKPRANAAAALLQRLLKGRAVQNAMYEGKERRLELVKELRVPETSAASARSTPEVDAKVSDVDKQLGHQVFKMLQLLAMENAAEQSSLLEGIRAERRAEKEAEENAAAIKIQSIARGNRTRHRIQQGYSQECAAPSGRDWAGSSERVYDVEADPLPTSSEPKYNPDTPVDEDEVYIDDLVSALLHMFDEEEKGPRQSSRAAAVATTQGSAPETSTAETEELLPVEDLLKDEELVKAATRIQALQRGRLARKGMGVSESASDAEDELLPVEEMLKDEELVKAATKIQALQRGRLARKTEKGDVRPGAEEDELLPVEEMLKDEELVKAATKIQALQRGRQARKGKGAVETEPSQEEELVPVEELLKDEELVKAATRIQALQRGRMSRRGAAADGKNATPGDDEELVPVEELLKDEELVKAATKIQALQRGRQARKAKHGEVISADEEELEPVEELLKGEELVKAATKIQALQRGRQARKGLPVEAGPEE